MITKVTMGLLALLLLGLSAFTIYDRWPNGADWGETSPRYPIGGTVTAPTSSCPANVLKMLERQCGLAPASKDASACQALADCYR